MKIYKPIKELNRDDINKICSRSGGCNTCVLHKACCLTDDIYSFIQRYKRLGMFDYEMERSVYVWEETEKS